MFGKFGDRPRFSPADPSLTRSRGETWSVPGFQSCQRRRFISTSVMLHGTLDHQFLDLAYGARRIQVLRARVHAVHDAMTAEQAVRILEVVEPLSRSLVAAVCDETIRLKQPGRADELVRIPPERRAGGRAARAQDAFIEAVELLALLRGLQPLPFRRPG